MRMNLFILTIKCLEHNSVWLIVSSFMIPYMDSLKYDCSNSIIASRVTIRIFVPHFNLQTLKCKKLV